EKNTLATSSSWRPFASMMAESSSPVASRIAALVLDLTGVAAPIPRSRIASFVPMDAPPSTVRPAGAHDHPSRAGGRYLYGPNAPAAEYHAQPTEIRKEPSMALRAGLRAAGEHLNIIPNSLYSLLCGRGLHDVDQHA